MFTLVSIRKPVIQFLGAQKYPHSYQVIPSVWLFFEIIDQSVFSEYKSFVNSLFSSRESLIFPSFSCVFFLFTVKYRHRTVQEINGELGFCDTV